MRPTRLFFLFLIFILPSSLFAEDPVKITQDLSHVDIEFDGEKFRIERNQDTNHKLTNSFAKTSRPCPPFCINPISISDDVNTVGEVELLDFIKTDIKSGAGLLIDARMPEWYEKATIPGSINIPFTVLSSGLDSPHTVKILKLLGATETNAKDEDLKLEFSNVKKLALFCNGIWCGQSARAIRNLISLGYPEDKLLWYRGGMQSWLILGFNTITP